MIHLSIFKVGLLQFLEKDSPDMAKFLAKFRVGYELYSRISDQSHIEACQVAQNFISQLN